MTDISQTPNASPTDSPTAASSPAAPSASSAIAPGSGLPERRTGAGARLKGERGTTQIGDIVVAKVATLATREIPGVYALGKGLARAFGALRSRIPGSSTESTTQGVSVEVGERQAAIDIDIVVEYGNSIVEVTESVRANVIERIESMTGLDVVEVNITVDDLHIEGEDSTGPTSSRVE